MGGAEGPLARPGRTAAGGAGRRPQPGGGEFEGVHAGQHRGSGAVIVWDEGTAEIVRDEPDHLSFVLHGRKLTGRFGLTRTGERSWLLVKARDDAARAGFDVVAEQPASVRSGRTWQELADDGA